MKVQEAESVYEVKAELTHPITVSHEKNKHKPAEKKPEEPVNVQETAPVHEEKA